MIDEQFKDQVLRDTLKKQQTQHDLLEQDSNGSLKEHFQVIINDYEKQKSDLIEEINIWIKLYENAKNKIKMLKKLNELNINDFHDVVDQRDWYYEEYRKLKDKLA